MSFINEKCLASGVGGSADTIHFIRPAGNAPSITVVMVTAGHSACGPVTAMRSLSSALGNRHDQEGAASPRPGGGGRRDGHDRRHPGRRRPGHADGDQAPARPPDPARAGCHRGGHRMRRGGPGGVRGHADRESGKAPAPEGQDGSPARSRPPRPRGGHPGSRQTSGAWHGPASGRHPAGRRSRATRRRGAFRAAARAEPDERLLTGRAHRRAQGWPGTPNLGRRGHPGDPADRRTRPCAGSTGARSIRPGRISAVASWLSAGYEPGRSRPGAVRPSRPAGAAHAAA